ncbi:response regulator [Paenibacillus sp. 19GGS1-52]|uniref:response regulator n=1 Tax=Paenibacillus sp. 19GGS1-52 TaxID=2758563 RepID=UPI001EFB7C53|nr:response regulator [Paenibacillus sp. 19GGS1-52]ULO09840.1 response regulator [Paenibacillus sp. 19GGS1-52]
MHTIRVILADDEPVIIRGLKKLLAWEQLGLTIVGEASDGYELKQQIELCNPDLIISDISMPGYTGIDIIREIHDSGRPIKVIFISAYQEFSYARQAIQYGAMDYLVKPVNKNQLEQVVSRAVSQIRQESEGERNKKMLKSYEQKNLRLTIEELLDRLTDGNKGTAETLLELGITAISRYVSICVLETDEYAGQPSRWEERERKLVEFALSNIIKETVDQVDNSYMFRKGERFCILLQHEHSGDPERLADDLHGKINSFLKLPVSIGVGNTVEGMDIADESYRSAVRALNRKYFVGLNHVIPSRLEQPAGEIQTLTSLNELQSALRTALKCQDKEQIVECTNHLLQTIRVLAVDNKNQAVSSVYNTIVQLEQELANFGVEANPAGQDSSPMLEKLTNLSTYTEVEQEFSVILGKMSEQIGGRMVNKEMVQLSQVKIFMEEHYAENITLESIAGMMFMNPYYFSSFFKKHTGQNFKNYVTEVRMNRALQLLLQSDMMVYEIAESVGYNNARHFSDMFKKKYGKLPQEYKQSFKNQ